MPNDAEIRSDPAAVRRAPYLSAARAAFFAHGYAATTMSAIARDVGGSKTTLWTYFPSKEDLFAAVVDDIIEQFGSVLAVELSPSRNFTEVLFDFARALRATLAADAILALNRLVIAEAPRFPHLAELFYQRGPGRAKARLAAYFGAMMRSGVMHRGDAQVATRQFSGLCQGDILQRALLGLETIRCDEASMIEMRLAVEGFVKAWSPA